MAGSVEKIYSDALYELAAEQNAVETVNGELKALAAVFDENPELVKLLCAPTVPNDEKLKVISNIFGGRVSETVYNFLCLLTEKGRAAYLSKIADSFRKKYNELAGIAEVTVTTSTELSPTLEKKLADKLEKVFGKKISMIKKVDPSILGGVVISCGGTLMDGSVRAKLDAVKAKIGSLIA